MYSCGYVAVIGKTNVGKSSLVNALVGEKVSIVTPKTQTTRENIIGIVTQDDFQIVFVDTPGIHKSQNNLDKFMMKSVRNAIATVDVLVYVIDGSKKLDNKELANIKKYSGEENLPTVVGISKIDLVKKSDLLPFLAQLQQLDFVKAIVPFSSVSHVNLEALQNEIVTLLPKYEEKQLLYDEDLYTDKSVRFLSAEIVREKAMLKLEDELPHGVAIEVIKFDEKDDIVFIDMDIICEKEGHKAIIVGKNGAKVKEIGSLAHVEIENLLRKKVMLKIFVKVEKNWRQNKIFMV